MNKQIEWNNLINEALTVEGSLGNVYNRFYNYSYMNQILLYLQGVKEPVGTYKVWQANKRQVKKGSKASFIIKPTFYKNEDEELELGGFKAMNCIFSLSQTEGEELKPLEANNWKLERVLNKYDINLVEFEKMNGNIQGYSFKKNIAINPLAKAPLKTTMHELAHVLLGHTTEGNNEHAGIIEFQAEAVAYIVAKELDLEAFDASSSRAYIQGWLKNEKPEDKQIKQVFKVVNDILTAGKPERTYEKDQNRN